MGRGKIMRTQRELFLNFDLEEFESFTGKLKKSSNDLNIQKSAITEQLMERKITKLLDNHLPFLSNQKCKCENFECLKICDSYQLVSKQFLEKDAENVELKKQLDAAQNVIATLSN